VGVDEVSEQPDAEEPHGSTMTVPSEPPFGPVRKNVKAGGAQLVVLVGRDVGRRFSVGEAQVIGRANSAEVYAEDEGISRQHARLTRVSPNAYQIEDLDSRNGTYLNGTRVKQAQLQFGDKIALGEGTVFLFTRQDAFEDRLLQAQRLQALGQIAGGIGHDFNNMLGAVLTNVTHLRELQGLDESTVRESLGEVEAAIRRTVGLTNQLLAFAQTQQLTVRRVDMSRLVEDLTRLVRRTVDRSIVLRTDIEQNLSVQGDSSQLLQALMNLCINAGDAMPEGGALTIRASSEPTDVIGGEKTLLVIEDTGVGMDEITRERLFEPFFSTKPRSKGAAGMGLARVYAVVRDHGGSIEVSSEPGEGTRFEIRLASATATAGQRRPSGPWPEAAPITGGIAMLVDDEELVRFALARVLRHNGLEVLTAADGVEALEVFEREGSRINIVILDLDMPRMDGEETYRRLHALDPNLRVIISSGSSDPDREQDLVDAGVSGVLRKPYDSSTLVSAVAAVLRDA
jgi:signal transduction histidine kinase/CheY-like chemotaxis protein